MEVKSSIASETPKQKTTAIKSTQTANEAYKVVKRMYARAREAVEQGAPVAWVMVSCCAEEILKTMGVVPVYTENYGAVCAAKKAAEPFLYSAEAHGFSGHLCGYARNGIGYAIQQKELGIIPPAAPAGGMAYPSVLIGGSHVCDPRYKWYQALGRYMDVPYYAVEILEPPITADYEAVKQYYIDYMVAELKGLQSFLESHLGRRLNQDLLMESVHMAEQTHTKWWQCYELRKAIPCPVPSQDMFSCLVPADFDPCDRESLAFYERLYDELKYRVDNKIGVIPDEKYRLLWGGGLPPWHTMNIFNYFESLGAVVVMDLPYYPGSPCLEVADCADPIERIVRWIFHRFTEWHTRAARGCGNAIIQRLLEWVDDYHIDGIIMHGSESCRASSFGQLFFKNVLHEHSKVPVLFIESDIVDERNYSEADMKRRIDDFMGVVALSKEKRG
jgi:benzoyl-CoA reductase/2-hydroxyglutaryl-CoA dehydratase subunit BcrC/BadD/HgdB